MKKILALTMVFGAVISTNVNAQSTQAAQPVAKTESKAPAAAPSAATFSADDAAMLQRAKEQQSAPMVEKTGITSAQADRIIEINFETRVAARALQGLSEADRSARIAELKAQKEKKYAEVLSADQLKAVASYYEEMGKNMQKRAN